MAFERGDQLVEPGGLPEIVIAAPGEVARIGPVAPGPLEHRAPRARQPEPLGVGGEVHALVAFGDPGRELGRRVVGAVVEQQDHEVAAGLAQQRADRALHVLGVVIERAPEHRDRAPIVHDTHGC